MNLNLNLAYFGTKHKIQKLKLREIIQLNACSLLFVAPEFGKANWIWNDKRKMLEQGIFLEDSMEVSIECITVER